MPDLGDMFGRPKGAPDNPDFWKLSNVLLKLDSGLDPSNPDVEAKEAQFKARVAEIGVDDETLAYVAMQRAYRVAGVTSPLDLMNPAMMERIFMLTAIWLDAFATGVFFERQS